MKFPDAFNVVVEDINESKAFFKAAISIVDFATPVTLEYTQVEKFKPVQSVFFGDTIL